MLTRNFFGRDKTQTNTSGVSRHFPISAPGERNSSPAKRQTQSEFVCLFEPIYRREEHHFVPAGHKLISRLKGALGKKDSSPSGYEEDSSLDLSRAIEMGISQLEMLESQVEAFLANKTQQQEQKLVVEVDIYDLQHNQQNLAKLGMIIGQSAMKGLQPRDIVVEISGAVSLDPGIVYTIAMQFKELGVMVALINLDADQFSFKRIFQVQPQIVKFNRSWFEQDISDPDYIAMVNMLVRMIHRKKIFTTQTGVRNEEEFQFAAACGFSRCQGSYFGVASSYMEKGEFIPLPQAMVSVA